MVKTQVYRNRQAGFADLLQYAAVIDEGIVVCKDGTLLTGFFYRGSDTQSSTDDIINHQAMIINDVFKDLGSGWMIHVDAIRNAASPYSLDERSHFSDPISQMIEQERKAFFSDAGNSYESTYCLCVSYQPPLIAEKKIVDLMFKDDVSGTEQKQDHILNEFKEAIKNIEARLSSVIALRQMLTTEFVDATGETHLNEEILSYINFCITGNNQPIKLPAIPMYLDAIVGRHDFLGGIEPKIDDKHILTIAIDGFPSESQPNILQLLDNLGTEYRWSTRFIFLDAHQAEANLKKYRRKWKQKIVGIWDQVFRTNKGVVNTDAALMVEQTDSAINDVNSGNIAFGYYTSCLVFMGSDFQQLEALGKEVVNIIRSTGFSARIETINAIEAWLGTLPAHSQENVRRPLLHTFNLAHLLPTSAVWPGHEFCPCPMFPEQSPALMHCATQGNTPFRFNLHSGDLGHTLVIGPPGAGKSTLLALIATQFTRYQNASVCSFDKGRSLYALSKAIQGNHFDLGGDSSLAFSPLSHVKTDADIAWFQDWLESIIHLQGFDLDPGRRVLISEAIRSCLSTDSKTLSDLNVAIQDSAIKNCLEPYCLGGAFGHFLDAEHDCLDLSDFNVFEVEELMNLNDKIRLPVLTYIFWRIEKTLSGQPALLLLDEAWIMLSHPLFREKIREWLKVLRKANCSVILATQSISDAANSGILDVLQEATATKIWLANPEANTPESRMLYEKFNLNQTEINIIARAIKKQDYYYTSPEGKRLINLALGPASLAFLGVSDKESIATIKQLETDYPETWQGEWLIENGVSNYSLERKVS